MKLFWKGLFAVFTLSTILFVGCRTADYDLRTIRDDRNYVHADSVTTGMWWRTSFWTDYHANQWSSAGVIITNEQNLLRGDPYVYWLIVNRIRILCLCCNLLLLYSGRLHGIWLIRVRIVPIRVRIGT